MGRGKEVGGIKVASMIVIWALVGGAFYYQSIINKQLHGGEEWNRRKGTTRLP